MSAVLSDPPSRTRKVRSWPQQNPPPLYAVVRDPRCGPPKPPRHAASCQLRKPSICAGSSPDLRNKQSKNHCQTWKRPQVVCDVAKRTSRSLDAVNFESTSDCSTSEYFTPPTSAGSIWELDPSTAVLVSLPASAPSSPCDWKRRSPEFSPAPKSFGSLNFPKPRRGALWGLLSKLPVQRHKRTKFPPRYDLEIGPPTLISHTRGQRIDWVRYFSENSLPEVGCVRRSPNDFALRYQEFLSQDQESSPRYHYRRFYGKPDIPDQRCPDVLSEALCLHAPQCSPLRCSLHDRRLEALEYRFQEERSSCRGGAGPPQGSPLPSGCNENENIRSPPPPPPRTPLRSPDMKQSPCSPLNCVFYVDFNTPVKSE